MLELIDLSLSYAGRAVLQGVSLQVAAGETLALLGPSGEGKSSLLSLVAGLQRPAAGQVRLGGQDITRLPPEQRHIAMMFQDHALFPHLDAAANVAFGLVERGAGKLAARQQAVQMLAAVQPDSQLLAHARRALPGQLAYAQQQLPGLAALARHGDTPAVGLSLGGDDVAARLAGPQHKGLRRDGVVVKYIVEADKARHPGAGRRLQNGLRRALLHDAPRLQNGHALRQRKRLVAVVRHQ